MCQRLVHGRLSKMELKTEAEAGILHRREIWVPKKSPKGFLTGSYIVVKDSLIVVKGNILCQF